MLTMGSAPSRTRVHRFNNDFLPSNILSTDSERVRFVFDGFPLTGKQFEVTVTHDHLRTMFRMMLARSKDEAKNVYVLAYRDMIHAVGEFAAIREAAAQGDQGARHQITSFNRDVLTAYVARQVIYDIAAPIVAVVLIDDM
jgi:hypothetical protein